MQHAKRQAKHYIHCVYTNRLFPRTTVQHVMLLNFIDVNAVIHEYTIIPSFLLLLEIRHTVDLDIFVYPFFVPVNFCCI